MTAVVTMYWLFSMSVGAGAFYYGTLGGNSSFLKFELETTVTTLYFAIFLMLITAFTLNLGAYCTGKKILQKKVFPESFRKVLRRYIIYFPFALVPFLFLDFRPGLLGSSGNFSSFFYWFLTIFSVCLVVTNKKILFVVGGILFFLLLSVSAGDRRDVIYCLLISFIIYKNFNGLKGIGLLITIFLFIALIFSSVIYMSSLRANSNLSSNLTIGILLANIDVIYYYFHGINSVILAIENLNLLAYGETIIKPLFILFPRELIGDLKPESMLTQYTSIYDPAYRAAGNSYPVNFISELIWNFYILAPFFSYIFGAVLKVWEIKAWKSIYSRAYLKAGLLFSSWYLILNVFRGAGIEFFIYGFCFLIIAMCLAKYVSFKGAINPNGT
ncbi:oligosaccharide repeat unit polymerase [Amylibacter sp.]|nr:oligosaccharide repeat unit polymerase [Amylibacter sp.]